MMTAEIVLGGIVISVISGAIGSVISGKGKVSEKLCSERQRGCNAQVSLKLDHITSVVNDIKKKLDGRT